MIFNISKDDKDYKSEAKVLIGEKILLSVQDLPSNRNVTIHLRRSDDQNQLWYSNATYISDDDGKVQTTKNNARSGSYTGIDPVGLFWSMELIKKPDTLPEYLGDIKDKNPGKIVLYFDIEVDGELVASKALETLRMLPETVKKR